MTETVDPIIQSMIDAGTIEAPAQQTTQQVAETVQETATQVEEVKEVAQETKQETIQETAAETKVAETVIEQSKPIEITDEIRLNTINQVLGTQYASLDEVNSLKGDLASIPTLKEQAATPKIKFANDSFKELNSFALATGINDASVIKDLKRYTNTESKDPIEAMVIAEIIKDPSLADDKDRLRNYIKSNYNTTIDPDLDETSEQNRVDMVNFKIKRDASAANTLINETMGKVANFKQEADPDNSAAIQQAKTENLSAWNSVLADNKFTDQFNSIEVEVPMGKYDDDTDLGTENVKIEVTADQKKQAIANIKSLIEQGYPCTKENINAALTFEQLKIKNENMQSLITAASKQFLSKAKASWENKIHNPSSTKIEKNIPIETDKNKIEDVGEWALKNMNLMG